LKVAVTVRFAFSRSEHALPVTESQPVQPTNVWPAAGLAVKPIELPRLNAALQVVGQVIPEGALLTVPAPTGPEIATLKIAWLHVAVPRPAPVRNAVPNKSLLPSWKLAIKFPLPQMLVEVTKPGLVMLAKF
jgi:hypothetical protein